jgi:hypothetical protein
MKNVGRIQVTPLGEEGEKATSVVVTMPFASVAAGDAEETDSRNIRRVGKCSLSGQRRE